MNTRRTRTNPRRIAGRLGLALLTLAPIASMAAAAAPASAGLPPSTPILPYCWNGELVDLRTHTCPPPPPPHSEWGAWKETTIARTSGVYGDASLGLRKNGDYAFHVHLDNANAAARSTSTVCVVPLRGGEVMSFGVSGRVTGGILDFFGHTDPQRDWYVSDTSLRVKAHFADIVPGSKLDCRVSVSLDVTKLLKQIVLGYTIGTTAIEVLAA